jgi:hypothetical protein
MAKVKMTSESVKAAESVLEELKEQANKAHQDEDVFMMSLMTELISATSPIVTKAINRLHREERATINAKHKKLREKVREAPDTDSDSDND